MNENILLKVKNLLELSKKNTNINESAAAYKAAQKLLTRHKLSMADVMATQDSRVEISQSNDPLYEGKRAIAWRGTLASGIAEVNDCFTYWGKIWSTRGYWLNYLYVVGTSEDVEIVRWLFNSVSNQIEIFCKAAMVAGLGKGKTYANNFKRGAVNTVISRLEEAKVEVEEEYEGSNALVLMQKYSAELESAKEKIGLKTIHFHSRYDDNGYQANFFLGAL